eukprot:TRINITY_DN9774_c0_g1_i1.p1 TRINITY_DN9774_c0_g1~~TRINITY_DN9774_c0_g1_i1.p1  ORF type:complete len:414 (+),score=67.56 TRINITY_DN9774_c0_g1_i1:151-1392(+)
MSYTMSKRLALRGLTSNFSLAAAHLPPFAAAASTATSSLAELLTAGGAAAAVQPCAKQTAASWQCYADVARIHVRGYATAGSPRQLPGLPQHCQNSLMSAAVPFATGSIIGKGPGAGHLRWDACRQLRGVVHKAGDPLIGGEPEKKLPEEENQARAEQRGATSQNYWSIPTRKYTREDGTEWPWHSFSPDEAYKPDTTIDMTKHHKPETMGDWVALKVVKLLRIPTDLLFQRRYGCRAMMLETVAAVPGMVGGLLLHLQSLRRFEHTGGWIRTLLDEAENERMHLMTFMEVSQPKWWERMLVMAVQGVFFNAYFVIYLMAPRVAHRVVGYLEEEAIHSYTEFLKEIDNGNIPNVPAPQIAIDYWSLPKDAKLRDVVVVVRADEAHHRDVNHFASGVLREGKKLHQVGAPQDYH